MAKSLIIFFSVLSFHLNGQDFQISYKGQSLAPLYTRYLEKLPNSDLMTFHYLIGEKPGYASVFSEDGELKASYSLEVDLPSSDIFAPTGFSASDSIFAFTHLRFEGNPLLVINLNNQQVFGKKLKNANTIFDGGTLNATAILEQQIVVTRASSISSIQGNTVAFSVSAFDFNGQNTWNNVYGFSQGTIVRNILALNSGNFLVSGEYSQMNRSFIVEISKEGEPIKSIDLDGFKLRKIEQDLSSHIYVTGVNIVNGRANGVIVHLDSAMNLIFSSEVEIIGLSYGFINFYVDDENLYHIAYSGQGDLPIISFEIDQVGQVLNQQGYAKPSSFMNFMDDGSLVFLSNYIYLSNNEIDGNRLTLARTKSDGTFEDCPNYESCILRYDLEVTISDSDVYFETTDTLESLPVLVEEVTWQFEPYCYTPPAPTPNFHHPDTICLNACPTPDSLENFYAHAQEWTITAPDGSDTLILDKAPAYCFTQEGTYLIEQTIWFLGCDYSYEQTVEVVPAMNINLGDDGINCNALPYELTLQSNRPIMSYEWSDGSTNPTLMLTESGTYWVAARGPYCEAVERDTITIEFIEDYVDLPLFTLPSDTSICIQHYPYTITPQSSSALSYTLNSATNAAPSHAITQAGSYIFATTLEGCTFQDTINITTNDCQASIYLPNAFSPNFDGINDELFPQGINFETISLEVFDRWGGLVAQSTDSRASWDGVGASVGVYVIQLTYRNMLSNEVEVLVKDVVVIK